MATVIIDLRHELPDTAKRALRLLAARDCALVYLVPRGKAGVVANWLRPPGRSSVIESDSVEGGLHTMLSTINEFAREGLDGFIPPLMKFNSGTIGFTTDEATKRLFRKYNVRGWKV